MEAFTVTYDMTMNGIRVVKAAMGPFSAVFTCNTMLGHCTARFDGNMPFSPDIQYLGGALCLSYPPTAIPPGSEPDFQAAWDAAVGFARGYADTVAAIMSAIEEGRDVPAP